MNGIKVTQGSSVLKSEMNINHAEFAIFDCGNGQEPQNRIFQCDGGAWIDKDDDKDWTFENKGAFPQCRNGKHYYTPVNGV